MKRAARGSAKSRGMAGARQKTPMAPAEPPAVKVLEARLQALEIENAKLRTVAGQMEVFVSALEKLAEDNAKNREAMNALQQEVLKKTQELQSNLIEKEQVRAYLSTILESLPNGVMTTDLAGSITGVNRKAKEILGREGVELLGEDINTVIGARIVPPDEPPDPLASPIALARASGETLKLQISVTPLKDAERQTGYVVNLQDVTLLKKLEEQSARRDRFTAMGEMAANIAHEIRNPLGSIELFTSLVRKGLDGDDEKMAHLNRISSAVTSMNHIISNVLEYTKPRTVSLKELDLHALLHELEGFFSFQCQQNGVILMLNLEAPDPRIRADREMLKQVFHNLLLNAVQAMPEGGRLTLATRVRAVSAADLPPSLRRAAGAETGTRSVLEVTVRDTGLGMPPEVQRKIFDPFFTTKSRGTGLGLAITHAIVEAHQATIAVESQVGLGTAMVLMFPLPRE